MADLKCIKENQVHYVGLHDYISLERETKRKPAMIKIVVPDSLVKGLIDNAGFFSKIPIRGLRLIWDEYGEELKKGTQIKL